MVHCICGDKPKQCDSALPQIEFAFNCMRNRSTGKTPIKIVYTNHPRHTLDLVELPNVPGVSQAAEQLAERIQQVHYEVVQNLEAAN